MVKLTEDMVVARTRASDIRCVKKLNCWGAELSDISILRKMPNIELVSMSVNNITTLADFQQCPNLQELYVRKNTIKDLSEVCYLRDLSKLKNLWIAENPCAEYLPPESYRSAVLRTLPHLQVLDNKPVQPDEIQDALRHGLVLVHPDEKKEIEYEREMATYDQRPQQQSVYRMSYNQAALTDKKTEKLPPSSSSTPKTNLNKRPASVSNIDVCAISTPRSNAPYTTPSAPTRSGSIAAFPSRSESPVSQPVTNQYGTYDRKAYESAEDGYQRASSPQTFQHSVYSASQQQQYVTPTQHINQQQYSTPHQAATPNIDDNSNATTTNTTNPTSANTNNCQIPPLPENLQSNEVKVSEKSTPLAAINSAIVESNASTGNSTPVCSRKDSGESESISGGFIQGYRIGSAGSQPGQEYSSSSAYDISWQQSALGSGERVIHEIRRSSARPRSRNSNILSAMLNLIKELDYRSLEVLEGAVQSRMQELED